MYISKRRQRESEIDKKTGIFMCMHLCVRMLSIILTYVYIMRFANYVCYVYICNIYICGISMCK